MTTVTFKLDESEARRLPFLEPAVEHQMLVGGATTGAAMFGPGEQLVPLTTESVSEMPGEFP